MIFWARFNCWQFVVVIAGGGVKMDDVGAGLNQCLHCNCSLEIAAVKFGFLYHPAMVFVCPNCGVRRAELPKRIKVRDWVAGLRQKDTLVALHKATRHRVEKPSRQVNNATNKRLGVKYSKLAKMMD